MKGMVIYAHRLYRNGLVQRFDVQEFGEPLYKTVGAAVGGHIEIVHPVVLPDPYVMIVNEEGLFRGLDLNPLASILYDTPHHGQPIVGNAVIMKEGYVDGEPDIVGLDQDEINTVSYFLKVSQTLCEFFVLEYEEDPQ